MRKRLKRIKIGRQLEKTFQDVIVLIVGYFNHSQSITNNLSIRVERLEMLHVEKSEDKLNPQTGHNS